MTGNASSGAICGSYRGLPYCFTSCSRRTTRLVPFRHKFLDFGVQIASVGNRIGRFTCTAGLAGTAHGKTIKLNGFKKDSYGALEKKDYGKFVKFFRQASPYIEGHRGRTFVIVVPGEVVECKDVLYSLLEDITLLHGFGVKLVIVLGSHSQTRSLFRFSSVESSYSVDYRVTDADDLRAAVAAAGSARMEVEARLSKGPAVSMVRRHTRGLNQFHYSPAVQTVSGNYVAAKRKGIIDGVDMQYTGVVRFVQVEAVQKQLDADNIVMLSNLGFSAAGEVLNCDIYAVAARAAIDLQADKLLCLTLPDTLPLMLPTWLPVTDAERMLQKMSATDHQASIDSALGTGERNGNTSDSAEEAFDFDKWQGYGVPAPLMASVLACKNGVKRAHLVNAGRDGALLLELYARDGLGTMVSADFYEGIREAELSDLDDIAVLLKPLMDKGVLVHRTKDQLESELQYFTVFEEDGKVLGCASLKPLSADSRGIDVAELGAFCVHPQFRGSGRGDSMLDYLEQHARARGIQRLVLLTTRTADWFEQRGFLPAGPAHQSDMLPQDRRSKINPDRRSQLYVKDLHELELELSAGHLLAL